MSPSIFSRSVCPSGVGILPAIHNVTRNPQAYATIRKLTPQSASWKLEDYATFAKAKIKLEDALLVNGFTVGGRLIGAMEVNNVLLFHLPSVVSRHVVNHGREVNDAVMRGTQDHS